MAGRSDPADLWRLRGRKDDVVAAMLGELPGDRDTGSEAERAEDPVLRSLRGEQVFDTQDSPRDREIGMRLA